MTAGLRGARPKGALCGLLLLATFAPALPAHAQSDADSVDTSTTTSEQESTAAQDEPAAELPLEALAPPPAVDPVESAEPAAAPKAPEIEQIVVTGGIVRSLQSSADFKRGASAVVDSISAEDLGKFPDTNVAESLQRITGVGITRTRGGEGQFVTVRGLGEEFNAVTYNNRLLATENNGREFSFDVLASELIAGAEVFKTSIAKQGDGSLGGRVNLRPAMPLDFPGVRVAASVAGQYEDLAQTVGPRASGVASFTFNEGTMGLLGSFSYQRRVARTDVAESTFLVNNVQVDDGGFAGVTLDADGDGRNDITNARIVTNDARFNGFATSLVEQERERVGGTAAFQYRPSKRFTLTVDGLYTSFTTPSTQYSYSYFPTLADPSRVAPNAVLNGSNQVISHSATPFATDLVVRENEGDNNTYAVGFNTDWRASDNIRVTADVSFSRASGQRDNLGSAGGSGGFFVIGYPDGAFRQFGTGNRVPDAFFTAANTPGGPQVNLSQLTPDDARLHFARNDFIQVVDQIVSARGDVEWKLDDVLRMTFGADVVNREKQNNAFNNIATQCAFCGYATPFADFGEAGRLFDGFTPSNFLSGTSANIPRVFPRLNPDAIRAAYAAAAAANGTPNALNTTLDRPASSTVKELVLGGYAQVDYSGALWELPYSVNFGVRLAYTDSTSTGFGNVVNDIISVVRASDGN
ncbi:MAG: TonB-dependent receptor, partial [Myxococcota bacterium]